MYIILKRSNRTTRSDMLRSNSVYIRLSNDGDTPSIRRVRRFNSKLSRSKLRFLAKIYKRWTSGYSRKHMEGFI